MERQCIPMERQEGQCIFYGETERQRIFYEKHNLYLNIKKFFKLKVLIKSDLTLTNECDV
jgi:hypothetical protein